MTTTISLSAVAPLVRDLRGIALLLDDGLHIHHVDYGPASGKSGSTLSESGSLSDQEG